MLALQLYIQGQEVDLYEDESVTLVQSIQDVKDIEKVFTDFTRTFSVPASKINNKIFQHFYNYHIIGFDARKKITAELYLNYELFKKGKIKLEGVSRKNNKPHTYKVTFFGNGINLKDLLGEDKLDSLPFLKDNFNFTYNDVNIRTYLGNGLDITAEDVTYTDAIIFPLITHTKRLIYDSGFSVSNNNSDKQNNIAYEAVTTDTGLQLSELKPALRVFPIIKAIEKAYDITFSTDFFTEDNAPFHQLYIWLHNKTGGLFVDEDNENPVGSFSLNYVNGSVLDLYDNYFVTPKPHQEGTKRGRAERLLDVTITPSISGEFTFTIYRNGNVFEQYSNITRDATSLDYKILELSLDAGRYTFTVESDTASTYDINFYVKRKKNIGGGYRDVHFSGTGSVLSNVPLRVSNQMPDIKVIDFLTSLFKMFNLTSFQNDSGVIEVKTLDSFYSDSTKIWDITEYVDKTESSVDSVLPYKQVDFNYQGLDNFFAKNHKELFNAEWGSEYYTAQDVDKIEGEVYTISIPLEHFKYERLRDVADSTFENLQWGWSADIKQQANLGKPLLFYPILQTETIGVLNSDGSKSQQTSVYIPSNSLQLTDSQNINFSAEPNEFLGTPFKKTLFAEYYKNYIKEIFDPQRRLTTTKAYLPLSMLLNFTLADKIRIFENLYRINKITTNFENKQSTLELINIKPQQGEQIFISPVVPDKFTPNATCITADATNYTADSTILSADSDCNDEGLEIKSTEEVIPRELDTGNKPLIDDHNLALPVTKASVTINPSPVTSTTTIMLSATVDELGTLGKVKQLDEYGFFYSTVQSSMLSNDIATLRLDSNVTEQKFTTTELNKRTNPALVQSAVTGLSPNTTVFYKFYLFTNTDPAFTITSVLSNLQQATTTSTI
tara:strand:- start:42 stop:2720 length:2679 start_codon:yes stop_codon:yes gene_type:complete